MIVVLVILLTSIGIAAEGTETFTWNLREELLVVAIGDSRVEGFREFVIELDKVLPGIGGWGRESILYLATDKKDLKNMRDNHTIFVIRPENLEEFKTLEAKYPELLPLSYGKLISYSFPLVYFSRDNNGKIRGVIVVDEVTSLLAKLLTKEGLPLNAPFWYENGQLKKIEKE
jgi:hypothetical protein